MKGCYFVVMPWEDELPRKKEMFFSFFSLHILYISLNSSGFLMSSGIENLNVLEIVGIIPWKLFSTPSKKIVKCKNIINSSFINHIAPPGDLLFLTLSVIEKNSQDLHYSIYFMVINNQIQFVILWFIMHSDWLRTCWKRTSLICTWGLLRTRIPQVVLSHYVGHSYVAETSPEAQGKASSH